MHHPLLLSIHVGLPQRTGREGTSDPMERLWTTAMYKEPVDGPVWLGSTNLDGDRQGDQKRHGGPDKAVLGYSAENYDAWRSDLDRPDFVFGSFGENFTMSQLSESNVCIGDSFEIGDAVVEVSEPRLPCWKLARRFQIRDFAVQVQAANRAGWYFRVLREGTVRVGLPVVLLERPYPGWTVARCMALLSQGLEPGDEVAELAACPALGREWRERLLGIGTANDQRRFWGPTSSEND